MVQEATREWGRKPSVAELESSILGQLQTYAAENKASLIVSWSQAGESYHWLQAWAAKHSIAFADWVPKADAVRAAIPKLSLDNLHSGAHHRGWTNQTIAREFARQIRARAS